MRQSEEVDRLALQIHYVTRILVHHEFRFHPDRKWRFDLALVDQRVGVEIDGGAFVGGRHGRGAGVRMDLVKCGEAMKLGWIVVRCMPEHVRTGEALSWVQAALRIQASRAVVLGIQPGVGSGKEAI